MLQDVTIEEILKKLNQRLEGDALSSLLPMYEALLRLGEDTTVPPVPLEMEEAALTSLLEKGIPLLQGGEPPILQELMTTVWCQVCDLATLYLENQAGRLQKVREWPVEQPQEWLTAMEQYWKDGEVGAEDQQEKDLLTFLMIHTWRPFLTRWAADLTVWVQGGKWGQNRCPVCGGQPDFAYLEVEEGGRHLVCARCDTDWRYQRLGCSFCGNKDSSTYGYYPSDDSRYRLYGCNGCHRYLKTLDLREAGSEWYLQVERIATIEMDLSALKAGYYST